MLCVMSCLGYLLNFFGHLTHLSLANTNRLNRIKKMTGIYLILLLSMLSLQHVPATRSVCRFKDAFNLVLVLECESATAQDIIREMEILSYNQSNNNSFIRGLRMGTSNITELDDQTFQYKELTGIEFLFLDRNQISKLPENLFNSHALRSLEYLRLSRNKISCLSSKQFHCLENLVELDLSYNELNHLGLPEGVFTSIPSSNLENIDLSHNKITFLPSGLFEGKALTSLLTLYLQNNHMSEIPRSVFVSNFLTNLTQVKLEHNFIHQIQPSSPLSESTLINLEELNLEFNQLETISVDLFHSNNWTSLKGLKLDNNNLSDLPDFMFTLPYFHKLERISVTNNLMEGLPGNLFFNSCLISLKYLNFSHNMIKTLPVKFFYPQTYFSIYPHTCNCSEMNQCPPFKGITHVDLSFNDISHIPIRFFRILENLKEIKLNNNMISMINVKCFPESLRQLKRLDLSHNFIKSNISEIFELALRSQERFLVLNVSHNQLTVQEDIIPFCPYTCFSRYRFAYIYLDMSYNNISEIFEPPAASKILYYTLMNSLKIAQLDYSHIVLSRVIGNVSGNHILNVNNLVQATLELDLNDFNLTVSDEILGYRYILRLHSFIRTFRYSYHCNCDMLKYLRFQKTRFFNVSLWQANRGYRLFGYIVSRSDFRRLRCGAPAELAGKYLSQLKTEELQCHDSKCTDSVKCSCTYTPSNYTVKINCTGNKLKYLPSITQNPSDLEVYLGFNDLKKIPVISLHVACKIMVLDLSYNFISSISNEFFTQYPKLRNLNLVGNLLINLPLIHEWNNLNHLYFLKLGENHFICNCSGLSLKKTLMHINKRVTISDIDKITCYLPEKVKNKVIYDSPDTLFGCHFLNLFLILTLFFTFLLFIVILLFIAYVFRDYIRLFLFIQFGWRFFYSYKKKETLYDVFISYSSLDSDWVINNLMNPLESLDPPYNLCLHERDFQVGIPICDNITRAIEGSKCTLVVVSKNWLESDWCQFEFRVAHCLATVEKKSRLIVLLQEKIPADEIKGDLELYIKTFTYLDSTNKLFWPRLLTDLPKPYINQAQNQNGAHDNNNIELRIL